MWGAIATAAAKYFGGSGSGPAAPSSAFLGGGSTFGFDNSNWTVATGNAKATGGVSPWVLAGGGVLALLVVWRLTKK